MEIISKNQALALGLNRFFTGKPCKRGHLRERFISGACCGCRELEYQRNWKIKYETDNLRTRVYKKFNGRCSYCGINIGIKKFQIDHLIPKSLQGSNEISNLMPACASCNNSKNKKDLESFRIKMGHRAENRPHINPKIMEFLSSRGIIIPEPERYLFWFERNN